MDWVHGVHGIGSRNDCCGVFHLRRTRIEVGIHAGPSCCSKHRDFIARSLSAGNQLRLLPIILAANTRFNHRSFAANVLALLLLTSTAAAAECRNIRVLDGDTIVSDIALGFDVVLHQQTIRIHNYDAWETSYRRQTIEYATDEMAKGALAKAALEKLLGSASKVTVQEVAGRDPYGRRLLDVYADGGSVGETLRAQGHERTEKRVSTLKND